MNSKKRVLVIGQTPPPYGGQALMIDYMLNSEFNDFDLFHVRMHFSKEMSDRGKFSLYKVSHLLSIILKTYRLKFKYRIDTLYYPPSNSPRISVFRDAIILLFTKFLFRKVIYHFHAAGISEELPKMGRINRGIIYHILKKPDLAITSSEFNPQDGAYLEAKKIVIIPLGIPEIKYESVPKTPGSFFSILFVGLLNGTKGEGYLLDAVALLLKKGYKIKLNIAGKFETESYKREFFEKVADYGITVDVEYLNVITGQLKHNAFVNADLFCFPSFFVSESFGIVLLEAMQYGLPIVATKWRGIQSIVEDDINGFLVPIKNADELSKKIELLFNDRPLLHHMSSNSKKLFLEKYTRKSYIDKLNNAFLCLY